MHKKGGYWFMFLFTDVFLRGALACKRGPSGRRPYAAATPAQIADRQLVNARLTIQQVRRHVVGDVAAEFWANVEGPDVACCHTAL